MEPKIKFNNNSWQKHKVGDLCDLLTGYPFPGDKILNRGNNLLMRGINITEGRIRHSDEIDRYYNEDTIGLEKYRLQVGDLVIGMDGSKVGKNSALVTSKENNSLLVQRVARLRNEDKNLINLIQIAVGSDKFIKYVEEMKTSSAIPHISPADIRNFPLSLPEDSNERRLVASYFTSFDSQISAATSRLASLKQMKAASLQAMFPQEGETVPKIRFKGFEGEWKKKLLNECLSVCTEKNFDNIYTKEDVLSVSDDFGICNQIKLLGRSYAGKSVANYGILHTGYIVYTKSPLKAKPYGIIKTNHGPTGIVSTLYAIYAPKKDTNADFIEVYFDHAERLNKYIHPLVNKGAKNDMKVSSENALKGFIMIPSLAEQQAIASYFTSLDRQISLQSQRLEKLKQIKSACLDKMFV